MSVTIDNGSAQQDLGNSLPGYLASIEVGVLLAAIQLGSFFILHKRAQGKWDLIRFRTLFQDIENPRIDVIGLFRLLRLLVTLFAVASVINLPVLLPLNFVHHHSSSAVRGLDRFSCLNILENETSRLWAHLLAAYGFTLLVCLNLRSEIRQFYQITRLKSDTVNQSIYLLTDVPASTKRTKLEEIFKRHFGCQTFVYTAKKHTKITLCDSKLVKRITQVEEFLMKQGNGQGDLDASVQESLVKRLNMLTKLCKETEHEYDMDSIALVRVIGRTHNQIPTDSAFWPIRVSRVDDSLADVNWFNARRSNLHRTITNTLMAFATLIASSVLALPVSFSASLAQIHYLAQEVSWLSWVNNVSPWALSYAQSVLPQLIVAGVIALVPSILSFLCRWHCHVTRTENDLVFQKYYSVFLFLQTFLLVSITSSVSITLSYIVHHPSAIPSVLALNLPKAGNYFLSYLTLQGLSLFAETVAQWRYFFKRLILNRMRTLTPRIVATKRSQDLFSLPSMYPVITILGVIGIVYSITNPLVLLPSSLAFIILLLAFKPALESFSPEGVDLGEGLFSQSMDTLFAGLYTMQLCLAGIFLSIKNEKGRYSCWLQALFATLLIFVTIWFQVVVFRKEKRVLTSLIPPDIEDRRIATTWFLSSVLTGFRSKLHRQTSLQLSRKETDIVSSRLPTLAQLGDPIRRCWFGTSFLNLEHNDISRKLSEARHIDDPSEKVGIGLQVHLQDNKSEIHFGQRVRIWVRWPTTDKSFQLLTLTICHLEKFNLVNFDRSVILERADGENRLIQL